MLADSLTIAAFRLSHWVLQNLAVLQLFQQVGAGRSENLQLMALPRYGTSRNDMPSVISHSERLLDCNFSGLGLCGIPGRLQVWKRHALQSKELAHGQIFTDNI